MAVSAATPAFQGTTPTGAQFRSINSWLCHCAAGYAAHPDRDRALVAGKRHRVTELARTPTMGSGHRNIAANGLRLLVVALRHAHGPVLLAISQRASHRSGSRRKHCRAISFW